MKKILVLCSGNSSRSQMAEGYLNYYAAGQADFFSAGLKDRGINPLTIEVMAEDNIDLAGHYSKNVEQFFKHRFDFLLTVCDEAYQRLPRQLSADRHLHFSIPDPDAVDGDLETRREAFREIRECVKKDILRFIGRELSCCPEPVVS